MKMTKFRWVICTMLFVATTVNYLDRQVLSLTFPDFIKPEFHWSDADYGTITASFSLIYAIACLFAGKFIDWMGTKKGYLWAIFVWSLGACMHAACGIATCWFVNDVNSVEALRAVQAGSATAAAIAGISVWLFLGCRAVLALGEAGNFPAAIKVTAEYFPKKDRAFATSIFNSGASVGALAAPLTIPPLAKFCGWEMAFIIIGGAGFIWMFFWQWLYTKPEKSKFVNEAELKYISQDDAESEKVGVAGVSPANDEKPISFFKCFTYRQTWSFIVGKFFTDGVWWFYLFWAPAYFKEQGHAPVTFTGQALIFTLYLIVTVVSIYGCKLPTIFIEKGFFGGNPYMCRMRAMLIFAFFPLAALVNLRVVPRHPHRPCRRRAPGVEREHLLDRWRHVPEVHHRLRHGHGRDGGRRRLLHHQQVRRLALHLRGGAGTSVLLPRLRGQARRLHDRVLLLRRGVPRRVVHHEDARAALQPDQGVRSDPP